MSIIYIFVGTLLTAGLFTQPPKPVRTFTDPAPQFQKLSKTAIKEPVGKATPQPLSGGSSSVGDVLDRIAQCESGGNPTRVSANGLYRGAWQFDLQTYHANGGSGDPIDHSYAEQKAVAQTLYAKRGGAPWPVCSKK